MDEVQREAENTRVRLLQQLVDQAAARICSGQLSIAEAVHLAAQTRREAEPLIPDQMDVYDLIYESRLTRLTWQFAVRKDA